MSFANDLSRAHRGMSALRKTMIVFSLIGLALSTYLMYEHFTDASSMLCSASGAVDCVRVTTSSYSSLFGMPVAVLGFVFYAILSALCIVDRPRRAIRWARTFMAASGLVVVLYLAWAEMQVGAICLWCTGVHVVTIVLLVVTLVDVLTAED